MRRFLRWSLISMLCIGAMHAYANMRGFFRIQSAGESRIISFEPDGTIVWSNAVEGGTGHIQRTAALPAEEGDWVDAHSFSATHQVMTANLALDSAPPGMVLIPGGTNEGTNPSPGNEQYSPIYYPETYSLTVSPFYMERYEVTKALWDEVYNWAVTNGYTFHHAGSGKDANHPVHTVNWYDVVKWCNARSQKEGRPPVYTVNGFVYKAGRRDDIFQNPVAGYRLPTDEEWEYAARGGAVGRRFPWSDVETIQHARANYNSSAMYSYDTSPTRGFHPGAGAIPGTMPVGSFPANGFGLHDMAGNVMEWCFDGQQYLHNSYARAARGGSWASHARWCRVGYRDIIGPTPAGYNIGFRTVLDFGPSSDAPIIRLAGILDFGEVEVGQIAMRVLTIFNDGHRPLQVSGINYPEGFSSSFSGTIVPGGLQMVTVVFSASAEQSYEGDLEVISDATGGITSFPLSGIGVADPPAPIHAPMVLIPGGTNAGINLLGEGEEYSPVWYPATYSLAVNPFYMDQYEVTRALWDDVYNWAITNGYAINNTGFGKGANHPVHTVTWYDAVKWCNARSEKEDRPPVYRVNGEVYRAGREDDVVQTAVAGYRLPTSDEWEYAARGGLTSRRFPWGDSDEIQHERANYWSSASHSYDTSPTRLHHWGFREGGPPFTAPVGSFAANAYGLHEMAGNIAEWCFDLFPGYDEPHRIARGGSWSSEAHHCRVGARHPLTPDYADYYCGFRTVLSFGESSEASIIRLEGDLDFGEVEIGLIASRTLTIYNDGSIPLSVTGIHYPEGFSGPFSGTIAPAEPQIVTVVFSPSSLQTYDGFLEVISDATGGTTTKNLSGVGTDSEGGSGDYLVIDLSEGPSASSYPIRYLSAMPAGGWTDEYKTTKLVLRRIPAGTFITGSPEDEVGAFGGENQHPVTLSKGFYMGVFEVTQKQWERVMGDWPSYFTNMAHRETRPVEQCSWNDIRGGTWPGDPPGSGQPGDGTFIQRISSRTGLAFDLPTEAQWEYACRAGTTTGLNSGKGLTSAWDPCPNMAEVGRYLHNGGSDSSAGVDTSRGTAEVGSYQPNAWGLYDMHGNVWEWCLDWFGMYPVQAIDPPGAASGGGRVPRGGAWGNLATFCRSAFRTSHFPSSRDSDFGFRLCRTLP